MCCLCAAKTHAGAFAGPEGRRIRRRSRPWWMERRRRQEALGPCRRQVPQTAKHKRMSVPDLESCAWTCACSQSARKDKYGSVHSVHSCPGIRGPAKWDLKLKSEFLCRWTGQKARGGGGPAGGRGGNKGNARRQDMMNLHMGVDQN